MRPREHLAHSGLVQLSLASRHHFGDLKLGNQNDLVSLAQPSRQLVVNILDLVFDFAQKILNESLCYDENSKREIRPPKRTVTYLTPTLRTTFPKPLRSHSHPLPTHSLPTPRQPPINPTFTAPNPILILILEPSP